MYVHTINVCIIWTCIQYAYILGTFVRAIRQIIYIYTKYLFHIYYIAYTFMDMIHWKQ